MNQREATCNTILAVLADRGVSYELDGETPVSAVLNSDDKTKVRAILFASFRAGKIDYKASFAPKVADDKELKEYISGLVNNWIRKAPEFNGGATYQAKNPGSRAGSGDEMVREMKKLLSVTTDAEARAVIQTAIEERQAAIAPKTEINLDAIPAELRAKLGL